MNKTKELHSTPLKKSGNYLINQQIQDRQPSAKHLNFPSVPIRSREENLQIPDITFWFAKQTEPKISQSKYRHLGKRKTSSNNKSENKRLTFENEELSITIARLQALLEEEEEDDYGVAKPSIYAYGTALALVSEASRLMASLFRKASTSTDDRGGIRLTWSRPEAEVRLVCAHQSDKPTYLYHEVGNEYEVERDVSASTVAHWLDWLNQI